MRFKQLSAALAVVLVLAGAVVVLGDTLGRTPATADSATQDESVERDASDNEHEDDHEDDDDDAADEEEGAHLAGEATLSMEEAIAIAGNEVDGTVGEVELEREGGRLLYEISFDSGFEVEVDADTGEVVDVERDDD